MARSPLACVLVSPSPREFAGEPAVVLDAVKAKTVLVAALRQLHGATGAAVALDVLRVDAGSHALVRVATDGAVRLQSALTLCGSYDGRACALRVVHASSFLAGLAVDSRCF
jgi:hypothetical protein